MSGNVASIPLPPRGIVCPDCKSPTRVVKARRPCCGLITRTRECLRCKRRVMTDERVRLPRHVSAARRPLMDIPHAA